MTPSKTLHAPSLADRIRTASAAGDLVLPPLPEVVTRLMSMLRDEGTADASRVGEVVASDPAIAAAVMRLSNSAAFGGLNTVTELGQAVARVGLRQVSGLVTAIGHKRHYTPRNPADARQLHALWDHAVVTALAARRLTSMGEGDHAQAFLAGLLHDTGKLVVLQALCDLGDDVGPVTPAVTDELMALLHPELGHAVLKAWKIPEPVCRVALEHHSDSSDGLVLRVQAANRIARKLGAHPQPAPDMDLYAETPIERLNLGELELATLMVDVEDEFARIREMF